MSDFEPDEYAEPLVKFLGNRYHPELPHIGTIGTADESEEIVDDSFVKDESEEDNEAAENEESEASSTAKKNGTEFSSFRFVPYSASYEMELHKQKRNLLTKFSFYIRTNEGCWEDLDGEDNPSFQKESQGTARDQGFWMTKNDLAKSFRKYDIEIESDIKTGKHGVSLCVDGKEASTDDTQHLKITNDDLEDGSKIRVVLTDMSDPFMTGFNKVFDITQQKYEIVFEKTTRVADDGTVKISVNVINRSPFNRVSLIPTLERISDEYETKDDAVKRHKEEVFTHSDQEKDMYSYWKPKLFNKKGAQWWCHGNMYGHLLEFSVAEEGIDSTNRPYESEKQVELITNLVHDEELQESSDGAVSGKITFMDHIIFDEKIPPMAIGGPLSETYGKIGISDRLSKMLEKKFASLYKFQADSIKAINSASGKDSDSAVLISSRTGGGKTEAFIIPIIDYCLANREHPGTKAIIFYPTKALANDQASRIISMLYEINKIFINEGSPERITVGMSHGDIPHNKQDLERTEKYWDGGVPIKCPKCNDGYLFGLEPKLVKCLSCKEELDFVFLFRDPNYGDLTDILITNPDTLVRDMFERPNHHGIFGRKIFCCNKCFAGYGTQKAGKCNACQNTALQEKRPLPPRFLVFDEIHQFKGTFGINALYLHERLKTIFKRYAKRNFGKDWPVCSIGSSATIADAGRFAKTFFGLDEGQITIIPKDDATKESYYEKAEGNFRKHVFLMPYRYRPAATCGKVAGYLQARRLIGAKPEPFSEMYDKTSDDPLQILGFVNNLGDVGELRNIVARERQDLVFEVDGHSTDYGQGDRGRAEREFNKKDVNVIFATPTLEVGVDFSTVNSVMIYGFPFSFNEYVQRIGRGGRKENSLVVTICHRWRPIDHYYMADARRKLSEQHRHYEPIPITRDNPNLIQKHLIGAFWDYISSLDDAHMLFGDIKRKLEPKVEEIGNSMFDTSEDHSPINALGLSESEKTEYQEFLKSYITMEKGRMAASPQQFTKKTFLYDDAKSPDRVYKLTNLRQIENSVEVELIWDVF
jgi:superfamily II DNA/RNA helicase